MIFEYKDIISLLGSPIKGIIHIGGHHCEECETYLNNEADRVLVFEPVPKHFSVMRENIKDERVKMYQVALGSVSKTAEMYLSEFDDDRKLGSYNGQSSSLLEPHLTLSTYPDIKFPNKIEVEVRTLDSFIESDGVDPAMFDMISLDVQGYELEALKGSQQFLPHIKCVYTEVNKAELYKNCPMVEDIDDFLGQYGFSRRRTVWVGNANWGDALYIKN